MTQELGLTSDKQRETHEWYAEVVRKADLADYSPVQGCMIIKPYGMKLWELIEDKLDTKFKNTGVQNAYFPLFIPERLLQKESEIVDGFDLEVAWLEQDEEKDQEERLAVRPTSESMITEFMSDEIRSHRQLPYRLNQWANVVRWEVSDTRPFLRTREFLWQEGHTAHTTTENAAEEADLRLEQYKELIEDEFAIPSIAGYKPEHDKFPGARYTMTLETLMPDGRSIQSCTSHHLGQHFAKAFDVTFEDEEGERQTAYTTSWGLSTRTIGAIVLAHGDDDGLVLPPRIAPIQTVIVPIHHGDDREKVMDYAEKVKERIPEDVRIELDDREHRTPGFKFNEWELKGVPLRLEIGPNEAENDAVTAVRRDDGSKKEMPIDEVENIETELEDIQSSLYSKLENYLDENIRSAESKQEILGTIGQNRGYVRSRWCGNEECETQIKDQVAAEIVVLPFEEDSEPERIAEESSLEGECAVCGEAADKWAYFAKNY